MPLSAEYYVTTSLQSDTLSSVALQGTDSTLLRDMMIEHIAISASEQDSHEELLFILAKIENLVRFDIIASLELAGDVFTRRALLDTYIEELADGIQQARLVYDNLQSFINMHDTARNVCLDQKQSSDRLVFDAMQRYDQSAWEESIDMSTYYEHCIVTNRIQANAYSMISDRFSSLIDIGEDKYNLLLQEYDTIIQYFDVLKLELLQKLEAILVQLQDYM